MVKADCLLSKKELSLRRKKMLPKTSMNFREQMKKDYSLLSEEEQSFVDMFVTPPFCPKCKEDSVKSKRGKNWVHYSCLFCDWTKEMSWSSGF
jgi:hypothetical protein